MNDLHKSALKPPVTIAIGLLGGDSILLASDSQTTRGKHKSQKAHKISTIKLADSEIMIAQAGYADHASKVLQILDRIGKDKRLTDPESFADLMKDALYEVRNELRRQRFDCSAEDLQEYLLTHETDCELMAAHYFDDTPYVYQASLTSPIIARVAGGSGEEFYSAMGTGAELALYLLDEFASPNMNFNHTFATLVYTIGEAKKGDTYCSGDTRLGFISSENRGGLIMQEIVNDVASKIERFNACTRDERSQKMNQMFETVAKAIPQKYGGQRAT